MNHHAGQTPSRARAAALLSALLLCAAPAARASDLLVDGQTDVSVVQGAPLTISVTGTPGALSYLLVDVSPGPTVLFGQSLPLGFTPAMFVVGLGPMPGGGSLSFPVLTPVDSALVGQTFFLMAVVADAPTPGGSDFSNGASVQIGGRDVQLAANPLPGYPHAEYVRAFNAGAPVSLAVDPLLHPELAGLSANAYVVAHKSPAQWAADSGLVDVRGAPTPVTFSGADLAGNTFTIDGGTLSGDAGASIGVGYDLVLDLDGDVLLGAAEPIDGFGSEAGFYVVHDVTQPGPLAVTELIYSGGSWLGQDLYFPTDIAIMGQLPLVVVSHGNGHNYQWYDHIGMHLASYGFIVMSHENNTQPGVEVASGTTLTNTDYLLGNLATIAGGALLGHLNGHNIAWMGHSRGGEGVARAYDRLVDGTFVPVNFTAADIRLVSSIAPTDFLGTVSATPHGVDYHLWVGGADADVTGCAGNDIAQSFHLLDRAEGKRMCISLHGVGHGDFHDSSGSVATGPCLVGKPDTHKIMKGYLLPLMEHHLRGNVPAQDFLWRQWERFRPIGAPALNACVVVDLQYTPAPLSGKFVIDNFQTNTATGLSSSGGAVTFTVPSFAEDRLDDPDSNFTDDGDVFNGFTEGRSTDTTRGLVFDFGGASEQQVSFDVVPAAQNAIGYTWLSFRAAQVTRVAATTSELGDLGFTVTLSDGSGGSASVSSSAYGGGTEEPYQRTSCGVGFGWGNEFETVRIRLTDFLTDGSGLDLSDLRAVTFRFGPGLSSTMGRLGLDDVEFTKN